jgi:hypothetical protein
MINDIRTAEAPKLAQWLNPPHPAIPLARYRLTLIEGESYTLPTSTHEVRILSGVACILDDESEVTLIHGEKRAIAAEQRESVISVSGDAPLVFEMALDAASEEAQCMKRRFYERIAARQQLIEVEQRSGSR